MLSNESLNHTLNESLWIGFFERRFPDVLEAFKRLGIYPKPNEIKIRCPFTNEKIIEDFSNISSHCFGVGICAGVLGYKLLSDGKISADEVYNAIKRGLYHDALKPFDVMLARALRIGAINKERYYSTDVFEVVSDSLLGLGFDYSDVSTLIHEYGKETDVRQCFHLFLDVEGADRISLSGGLWKYKLVHLADNMTASAPPTSRNGSPSTCFLTTTDRLRQTNVNKRYPWALQACVAISERGEIRLFADRAYVTSDCQALFDVHDGLRWLSRKISEEIMGVDGELAEIAARDLVLSKCNNENFLRDLDKIFSSRV